MVETAEYETVIVGGGPAGAAAAWELTRHGHDCVVLDRESFPREKLCAGWITPQVLEDLEFQPEDYPHRFLTFDALQINLGRLHVPFHSPQHSIRRFEFDRWLVERSGAPLIQHRVREVTVDARSLVIDGRFRCRNLIGAGGTRCPVERRFFRSVRARCKSLQVVTQELEFPCTAVGRDCHLWFFHDGLPGYAWYVPKAEGYVNVGVGGMAAKLTARRDSIRNQWQLLVARLRDLELLPADPGEPGGYSYYLRERTFTADRLQRDCATLREGDTALSARPGRVFLTGDAAGLATRDMCEGIGPAVRSGLLAARAILQDGAVDPAGIDPHTLGRPLVARGLDLAFTRNH
ncbi:MAG: FAD-dependent oxidoreductase [Pseudomonadales bacterium]|nr:FAD-dependent monooxygenase [Pseudomonadales bacterium]